MGENYTNKGILHSKNAADLVQMKHIIQHCIQNRGSLVFRSWFIHTEIRKYITKWEVNYNNNQSILIVREAY